MGANRGAIDAVVTAVRHDLGQRDRYGLPDPGIAPAPKPPVDGVPVTVFGRDIAPRRAAAEPPEYPVNDRPVRFGPPTSPPVRCINRQQTPQNTPFRFAQIASAQACLQKAALNQSRSFTSTNLSTPPSARRSRCCENKRAQRGCRSQPPPDSNSSCRSLSKVGESDRPFYCEDVEERFGKWRTCPLAFPLSQIGWEADIAHQRFKPRFGEMPRPSKV